LFCFFGRGRAAASLTGLKEHRVKRILNCADDVENFHEKEADLIYCNLHIADFGQDKGISRVFEEAFEFLNQTAENQEKVLVHCAGGYYELF
jgi:protein-tyrosine phosphatase